MIVALAWLACAPPAPERTSTPTAPAPTHDSTPPTTRPTAPTAATATTADTGPPPPEVTAALIDGVVLAHTAALEQATAAFAAEASAFCAAPDAEGFQAVRDAWWAARAPWKRLEVVNFGPATEEPWRIAPKLDFWPGRPASVEAYLASGAGVDVADFDLMGGATRGFPALEIVLWDGTDPLAALSADPHRCAYIRGGSADTHVLAQRLTEAWTTDWRARLVEPTRADDDGFDTAQDVVDEWVNRMAFTVEDLRFEKLGKPFGDDSGGEPQPDTMESRWSGRALTDARDALHGVADVFHGAPVGTGIRALLPPERADLVEAFDAAFDAADAALLAVPEPLETAIVDDREAVFAAQTALRDLQVVIQVDLAATLGVTIVFNDNDGD